MSPCAVAPRSDARCGRPRSDITGGHAGNAPLLGRILRPKSGIWPPPRGGTFAIYRKLRGRPAPRAPDLRRYGGTCRRCPPVRSQRCPPIRSPPSRSLLRCAALRCAAAAARSAAQRHPAQAGRPRRPPAQPLSATRTRRADLAALAAAAQRHPARADRPRRPLGRTSHNWCFGNFLRPAPCLRGPLRGLGRAGGAPVAYSSSRSSTTPSSPAPPGSSPLSPPGPPTPSLDPLTSTVPPAGSAPT